MSTNKFSKAAAARAAESSDAFGTGMGNQTSPRRGSRSTMTTTVEVPLQTRAALDKLFTELKWQYDQKVPLGPVTVVLYDLLLDNVTMLDSDGEPVNLQEEVMRRL